MKKKSLSKMITTLIIASLFLSGCGTQVQDVDGKAESKQVKEEQEEKGEIEGIRITDGAKYQYQLVKPEDIVVEFSGLKPDMSLAEYGGRYVTDTATYMSDTVGIYLDEKRFEAKVGEYVEYTDFSWSWDSERNYDLFVMAVEKSEVSPDFFKGSIVYSDGNEIEVKPDKVSLEFKGSEVEMVLSYRGIDSYEYFAVPDNWSDGEWRDHHIYEDPDEGTTDVGTSNKEDTSVSDGVVRADAPPTTPEEITSAEERRKAYLAEKKLQEEKEKAHNEKVNYAKEYYQGIMYEPYDKYDDSAKGEYDVDENLNMVVVSKATYTDEDVELHHLLNRLRSICAEEYANTGVLLDLSMFAYTDTKEKFAEQYNILYPSIKHLVNYDLLNLFSKK